MKNQKNYIKVKRHKWPDEIASEKKVTMKRFLLFLAFLLVFASGFTISHFVSDTIPSINSSKNVSDSEKLNEIYRIMENEWYFGKDIKDINDFLLSNAIEGLTTNEYDLHTNYLDSKKAATYMKKLEGNYVGIGIEYSMSNGAPVINKVYTNSPAKEAGLQPGDIMVEMNGIRLDGKSLDEIGELSLGEEGSTLNVTVKRKDKEIQYEIVRESISNTVYGYVKDGVGILEIASFSEKSDQEVGAYLEEFEKQNVDQIMIDLRDNGGGYLLSTIKIASYFLEPDTLVLQEEKRNGEIIEYNSTESTLYNYKQLVILVNQETASAAEALTAALKEQAGATVIGVNTYGKGTVQQPKVFKDGSYFKYTIAEWLTPNGEKINKKGIKPDIEVPLDAAITHAMVEEDASYQVDSVGRLVKDAQIFLSFLGYSIDRFDGYYSKDTLKAVEKYQKENELVVNGEIDNQLNTSILASAKVKWHDKKDTLDVQMKKALEVLNGK